MLTWQRNQEWINAVNIIRGTANSCGCRKIRAIKEEPGATYGRLTVIERDGSAGTRTAWKCRCICGEVITVSSNALRMGNTQSCGCLALDVAREKAHDLTGKRFGRLVAIRREEIYRENIAKTCCLGSSSWTGLGQVWTGSDRTKLGYVGKITTFWIQN